MGGRCIEKPVDLGRIAYCKVGPKEYFAGTTKLNRELNRVKGQQKLQLRDQKAINDKKSAERVREVDRLRRRIRTTLKVAGETKQNFGARIEGVLGNLVRLAELDTDAASNLVSETLKLVDRPDADPSIVRRAKIYSSMIDGDIHSAWEVAKDHFGVEIQRDMSPRQVHELLNPGAARGNARFRKFGNVKAYTKGSDR